MLNPLAAKRKRLQKDIYSSRKSHQLVPPQISMTRTIRPDLNSSSYKPNVSLGGVLSGNKMGLNMAGSIGNVSHRSGQVKQAPFPRVSSNMRFQTHEQVAADLRNLNENLFRNCLLNVSSARGRLKDSLEMAHRQVPF